jgi:hypothetical protein
MKSADAMNLERFVSESLLAIMKGVSSAADEAGKAEGKIGGVNPTVAARGIDLIKLVRDVSFDIAVTVSTESSGGGGADIKVLSASIGGKGTVTKEDSRVSRISFSVPVLMRTNPLK